MKKVLILSGPYQHGHRPRYSKLFSEAIQGYDFTDIEFDNLIIQINPDKFSITDSKSGLDIKDFDIVMVREYTGKYLDVAFVASKYLKLHKVKFFNEVYLNYRLISKLAQAAIFYELGIPFPATIFAIKHEVLLKACADMDPSYIAKEAQASHGDNNFLLQTREELQATFASHQEMKFIVQEYIPNDNDYRLLAMNRKVRLAIQRWGQAGSHLNNTSKGGVAKLVNDLPKEILAHVESLVNHLEVDLAGVDVVRSKKNGKYYFLEINFQPQIISGVNVDEKLAEFKIMLDAQFEGE